MLNNDFNIFFKILDISLQIKSKKNIKINPVIISLVA